MRKERAFLGVLWTKCTPREWGKIVDMAVAQAKDGDKEARAWLGKYLLPTPGAALDVPSGALLLEALERELHLRALGGDTVALLASLKALDPGRYGGIDAPDMDENDGVDFARKPSDLTNGDHGPREG